MFSKTLNLCYLLITFANSLDPDQNVSPDLDPKTGCRSDCIPERFFFEKVDFEKIRLQKSMQNYPILLGKKITHSPSKRPKLEFGPF